MRRIVTTTALLIATACAAMGLSAAPGLAQNPLAPRAIVNESVVTDWEVRQRAAFLALFNTPGDLEAEALARLIEERLQLQVARRMGVLPDDEAVREGMAEFAARVDLDTEGFLAAIAQGDVQPETFRDFVYAGLAWRQVVRQRFGDRVIVTEADVDRALQLTARRGAVRVLLSEIVLPDAPEFAQEVAAISERIRRIRSIDEFSEAARQFSVSPTRDRGGRLEWTPLANLPEELRPILLGLRPGQISPPVPVTDAIVFFQLRGIDRDDRLPDARVEVDYARALIPGAGTPAAEAEAARLRARTDICADLAALAPGQPDEAFIRETRLLTEVPPDIALELARLDPGEIATGVTAGGQLRLIMLCARQPEPASRPTQAVMFDRLANELVAAQAQGFLEELRADAHIVLR